ncbi:DUF5344 family protein [Metabacillus herbersteinensis]|uniref:DUF5344 family protein n=1 Tax=Metabacillus herbersteinensis TaxID=283816 RepID=A0ABV6GG97_9BACI
MSKEIKIDFSEVEEAISSATSAIQSVKTDLPTVEVGKNQLTSLTELQSLMNELTSAIINYQNILADQLEKTTSLIETVKETDRATASSMRKGDFV